MQSVKVGADSTFMCSLWSFPEYWRVLLKGHFVTGSRAFGGLLGYWVVLLESLVWVPIVIFGEVLSSLFPAESCGGACAQHFSERPGKGPGLSHSIGHSAAPWAAARAFQGHRESVPHGSSLERCWAPVLHTDETEYRNPVHGLLLVSAWHSIGGVSSAEEDSSHEAQLTDFTVGSGNGARPLLDTCWSVWRHLGVPALLSCCSISSLLVLKETFYSLSV